MVILFNKCFYTEIIPFITIHFRDIMHLKRSIVSIITILTCCISFYTLTPAAPTNVVLKDAIHLYERLVHFTQSIHRTGIVSIDIKGREAYLTLLNRFTLMLNRYNHHQNHLKQETIDDLNKIFGNIKTTIKYLDSLLMSPPPSTQERWEKFTSQIPLLHKLIAHYFNLDEQEKIFMEEVITDWGDSFKPNDNEYLTPLYDVLRFLENKFVRSFQKNAPLLAQVQKTFRSFFTKIMHQERAALHRLNILCSSAQNLIKNDQNESCKELSQNKLDYFLQQISYYCDYPLTSRSSTYALRLLYDLKIPS